MNRGTPEQWSAKDAKDAKNSGREDAGDPAILPAFRVPCGPRAGSEAPRLRGPRPGYPRSSSFTEVFARVLASTRLTITAQYRLWLPSSAGNEPLTTTLPAGTRP
jgi:hypothetical protein